MSRICPTGAGNIPRVHAEAARSRPGQQVGKVNALDMHGMAPDAGAFAAVQEALDLGAAGGSGFNRASHGGQAGSGDHATGTDAG